MKPYGREKKVTFPGKTDCHPRKGFVNWWERITNNLSRSAMKQKKGTENNNKDSNHEFELSV